MSPRALATLLGIYAGLLAVGCLVVFLRFRLRPSTIGDVESLWLRGALVLRRTEDDPPLRAPRAGEQRVVERVIAEGAVPRWPAVLLALSLTPGRDGLRATLDGKAELFTPDDLLAAQAYDHGPKLGSFEFPLGFGADAVRGLLARRFHASPGDILARVELTRFRTERPPSPGPTAEDVRREDVQAAMLAAARHLARGVGSNGQFRYQIDAPTGKTAPGYNWTRHAGSTWFLVQAAGITKDAEIRAAALRAASPLTKSVVSCGAHRCVANKDIAELGESAVLLFALVELVDTGIDPTVAPLAKNLAAFIRSQQRPDGEFMHRYQRKTNKPIDVQTPYTTGEAALGLALAYRVTRDEADLDAAAAAVDRLVGPNWSFFGDHYYYGEEHWTCEVLAEIWEKRPRPKALDFCLRWAAYNRKNQIAAGETPFDADGAHGVGPIPTPRLGPVAARAEATVATFDVARRAHVDPRELALLDQQMRRAIAVLLRHQLRPGRDHLFADPSAVVGAVPASEVDWTLRIDSTRHAAGTWLRWLALDRDPSPDPRR